MLDFRIMTFLSVCDTLNYTRAAKALNITQPAVSQHIAALEKEYATKLFSYENKKISLTQAGCLLRDAALTMAHDQRALRDAMASFSGERRSLRIGMTLTAGEYVLADPLAAYLNAHPAIHVRVSSSDTKHLLDLLQAGHLDCTFVEGFFDKSAYDWMAYDTEELVAVGAPCLAQKFAKGPYEFEDLLLEQVVVREEGSGTRAVLNHALAARNLSVKSFAHVTEVESINVIKRLVQQGLGISFLYDVAVQREIEEGTLVNILLAGSAIRHEITGLWLKGSVFGDEYRSFMCSLQKAKASAVQGGI